MAGCRRRPQWLSLGLLAAGTAVAAAPSPSPATAPAAARPAAATAGAPATAAEQAELLLYLSEFEDTQDDGIDPADLPPLPEDGDDAR
ncbi:hypothetical protein ACFJIW_07655 [Tahibacter sp. UC22_41]|uniref:hypothetical protein n=1 Tax=Tahibacter sp. UC22_41 TaxID=3350178 RepID=UPI0036D8A100